MDGDQRLEVEKQARPFRVFDAPNTQMFVQKNDEKPVFMVPKIQQNYPPAIQESTKTPAIQESG